MYNNVIPLGFKPGKDIHLMCTEEGLKKIPPPDINDGPWIDGYYDVFYKLNKVNLVALRLAGVLSERDIAPMLASIKEEENDT